MIKNIALSAMITLTAFSSLSCVRNSNVVFEPDADVATTVVEENAAPAPENGDVSVETTAVESDEFSLESRYKVSETLDLFDGKTLDGWTDASGGAPKGWIVEDGILRLVDPENGNDIITDQPFDSYVFTFEWRFGRGCNSGVKYKIEKPNENGWVGLEYQIQDDANVEDGKIDDRRIASLFDVFPATPSSKADDYPPPTTAEPAGNFRRGKIVVAGSHVEHWLDEERVLSFEIGSSEWDVAKKESKFKNQRRFGLVESSPILLQCHGYPVDFRNLKLRKLSPISDQ